MTVRRVCRFVSVALAGGLVLINVISLASGIDWRLDLLTHFRVHYAGLFLVLALVLAVQRCWVMMAAAMIGLIVNGWFIAPMYLSFGGEGSSDGAGPAVTLSILHFNVNFTNDHKEDVVALVLESGADVVFLHEVTPAWAVAMKELSGSYVEVEVAPQSDNFGVAMLVRDGAGLACVSSRVLELAGSGDGTPAIDSRVRVGGKEVRLLALHAPPPISGRLAAARDAQLRSAGAIASESEIPIVVVGDFNATPWSSAYRGMVRDGGLRDSLAGRGWRAGGGASWPAGVPALLRIPIDHCLIRGRVAVVERRLGAASGSDHRPLYVRISLD